LQESDIFTLIRTVERFSNESMLRWMRAFPHSVGISSILVLEALREKGPRKQSELADQFGYTPGAMTNIATKLIKTNYAKREYDRDDRRIIRLCITEEGVQLLHEARAVGEDLRAELFSVLSDEEIQQFLLIHEKLLTNFSE